MSRQRTAAIDLGSNTFRLLIAEPTDGTPPWRTVHYEHRIVRLGEGLHANGTLNTAARARALQALHAFAAILRKFDVPADATLAVATAAMREADNGPAFREQVLRETGIHIEIIDGAQEANLSLAGVRAVLHERVAKDFLLFDIGGGSTEFIRACATRCRDAISRRLGVVRLVERHLHSDPPSPEDYAAMIETAQEHLRAVERSWRDTYVPTHLVGTAGTVTTLAATELDLCPYDADVINNHVMTRSAFVRLRDRLLALDHAGREAIRTIEPGRADLIIAGLAIVEAVLDHWHYDAMTIVDAGLLEGAWLHTQRLA
ncbi:MAG: Ppx/GppA family phosphatase [Zetaproteobacteria bacterium]|nr:MAG: Ppx/GppA family phosphatase [Zetaproteobacteria bacterium]